MLENYKGKKIKRLPSIKDRMKGKELHNIFDVDDIFNINLLEKSHEEIIINIMEKVKKNPKQYENNGEGEIPYEMSRYLSKMFNKDYKYINEIYKRVIKEIESEKKAEFDFKNSNENRDLNFEEFIKLIGWNQNKFYKNIDNMCSKDVYDIDIGRFKKAGETKKDYEKDEREFSFKKEWNDIAILLFKMFAENPYYRANSKVTSINLEDVIVYNEKFLEAIKTEIKEYNSLEIRLHPVYQLTYAETLAMKKVKEKLQLFFSLMSEAPIESRSNMWLEISNKIDEVIIKNHVYSRQAKEEMEKYKGELFRNQMYGEYEHTSLDKYIAQVLKNEMDTNFREERLNINLEKHDWMRIFDKVAEILDGKEEVNKVNERWNKTGAEKNKIINEKNKFEKEIKQQLKTKKELVDRSTDIYGKIDKLIEYEKEHGNTKDVDVLKELQDILDKKNNNTGNIEAGVEHIIQEVNFNVMNRK